MTQHSPTSAGAGTAASTCRAACAGLAAFAGEYYSPEAATTYTLRVRDGKLVGVFPTEGMTQSHLTELMTGVPEARSGALGVDLAR